MNPRPSKWTISSFPNISRRFPLIYRRVLNGMGRVSIGVSIQLFPVEFPLMFPTAFSFSSSRRRCVVVARRSSGAFGVAELLLRCCCCQLQSAIFALLLHLGVGSLGAMLATSKWTISSFPNISRRFPLIYRRVLNGMGRVSIGVSIQLFPVEFPLMFPTAFSFSSSRRRCVVVARRSSGAFGVAELLLRCCCCQLQSAIFALLLHLGVGSLGAMLAMRGLGRRLPALARLSQSQGCSAAPLLDASTYAKEDHRVDDAAVALSPSMPLSSRHSSRGFASDALAGTASGTAAVPATVAALKNISSEITYDEHTHERVAPGDPSKKAFAYLVLTGGRFIYASALRILALKLILSMSASRDVLALASLEVDIGSIEPGSTVIVKWRGKPVFVRHRTEADIKLANSTPMNELRDPEEDAVRVQNPQWLVVVGVCTHLGCVPLPNAGDYGGWFCPCHGSHYDISGRVRKGPAPYNLEVPQYKFTEETKLLIG